MTDPARLDLPGSLAGPTGPQVLPGSPGEPTDLVALTRVLVAWASPSRAEDALATLLEGALRECPWLEVVRIGDNLVARTHLERASRLVVAGHLDTVPPAGPTEPGAGPLAGASCVDPDVVSGLGATDMKGGLAVMVDLARCLSAPAVDITWCFYAREEIARAESGLVEVFESRPDLLAADAAILGEPTGCVVEAGCQGTMRLQIHLGGRRAHTARPFTGVNAIHRLAPVLARLASWEGRSVVLQGCSFAEQLQAVGLAGGVAGNVVPDAASVTLNYRFAPDRDLAEARRALDALFDDLLEPGSGDRVELLDQAPGALPSLDHPLLARLLSATGRPPAAKVGWTDVATFAARGIPATNFGPGDPLRAHTPDEMVTRADLEQARRVLAALLS